MAKRKGVGSLSPGHQQPPRWSPSTSTGRRGPAVGVLHLFIMVCSHIAEGTAEAFIQSENIIEILHFGEGGLLQTESDLGLSSYQQKAASYHRGNCRPIRFEPPMLDFHEQPVGMPKMEKVYLHNPSTEDTIILVSISATTSHFHASFFQNRIIPPGGNTSFDVVFLARVVGNVENTLFINTSLHGVFTYQVFGVGIPNPYRLRPFIGARVPVNSSFSPLINIHNPHSEPLQVVEMYSSGGDLHLELPTGQPEGPRKLWEIPPYETKAVMRASFSSREADNHTAFIRIKTNASDNTEFLILPVEVEVTTAPGIYSSTEMLDFGTLRTQDLPKVLNLHLLNSGTKDVPITSIKPTPPNEAVTVDFKPITLKASETKYTKVASIIFDASKAKNTLQFSGKITVKAKEKNYSKLEIPYQAEVLEGYLGYDHAATLFHIRDSPTDPVERPIYLTNTFNFPIIIHNVSLLEDAKAMFKIKNFSEPVSVPPHEALYIFSLHFEATTSSIHIDSNILLVTNASKFHLPVRAYTGFLDYFVLPPSLEERIIDFGVLSAAEDGNVIFVIMNSNPIELAVKGWYVVGDGLSIELLIVERGNRSAISSVSDLEKSIPTEQSSVILASGYYAAFRMKLTAKELEGPYDGAVQITTDYEILTIQVKALIAVGSLVCSPKHVVLPGSFPGKVVHHSLNIMSSFSQKVKLQNIRPLTEDVRFYYKRMKNNKDDLESKKKSKIANIYFDASLQCGDYCYVGLPFLSKSELRLQHSLAMQDDAWDADWDLYKNLYKKWTELKENSGHKMQVVFEVDTDLQKNVQAVVTSELIWPSLINTTRDLIFPLTNTNNTSEKELILENPADVPVFVQLLPLALYPNPSFVADVLMERLHLSKHANLDTKTFEFKIVSNRTSSIKSSSGFVEGYSRQSVLNVILKSGEKRSMTVQFTPVYNRTVMSLIIIRNNLTVVDAVVVQGQGTTESVKVAGKHPGPGSSLRFKINEALLKDCSDKMKMKEPNFTLKRVFKVENTGQLPVLVKSMEISGYICEGYGFKVVNCQEFALKPNASKDIIILFTPDFTASRVIRELRLITAGGSQFVFILNASLPYHMLATCAEALPRPNWELGLYVIISGIMSVLFLLVIGTAYLEAQGIWGPFKRRLSLEGSNPPFDMGRTFDLRRIVGISSDGNLNALGSDSNHNSSRGVFGGGGSSRPSVANHKQIPAASQLHSNRNSLEFENPKLKNSFSNNSNSTGRTSTPTVPTTSATKANAIVSEANPPQSQTNRRTKTSRQFHQTHQQQTQIQPDLQSLPQLPAVPQQQEQQIENTVSHLSPPVTSCIDNANTRHSSEDSDIMSLGDAVDRDCELPESSTLDVFTEQPPSPASKTKGRVKLQRKTKAQKKREEKDRDRRVKGKPQEDDLKDADNDDSSSTTTETSNPDVESPLKESPDSDKKKGKTVLCIKEKDDTDMFHILKSKGKKPLGNVKKETQNDIKSSSLELPYTTPLENKQRKPFPAKIVSSTLTNCPKLRNLPKRVPGKLVDGRPSPLVKFLSSGSGQEMGNSSSSEGEKDSPPPEWDIVPISKSSSSSDSLQQLSIQTLHADVFLKRQSSPMPGPPSPPPGTSQNLIFRAPSYSSIVNNSDAGIKPVNSSKSKIVKSASLPGKNGNPTFAAVAAGYDKSPGSSSSMKTPLTKAEVCGSIPTPLCNSVASFDSDESDTSSSLLSPCSISTTSTTSEFAPPNSFSAFGPSNSFNLTGVFSPHVLSRATFNHQEVAQNWPDYSSASSTSIWDTTSPDARNTWPSNTVSPTHSTSSILLGNSTSSLWSTTPFSNPIWSTSRDNSLPFSTPASNNTMANVDLIGGENTAPGLIDDLVRMFDPWKNLDNIWRPTPGRRSSDPWSNNANFPHEN
ncbi:transmembrane protein 131 isoform X1 [Chiloscyllium punctatum]|uniref:transmembrane protein 131 isoform X1 n=1 Tax=Chiloscyllium punctatum TaxID=137246 RepID=UPI003B63CCB9